MPKAITNSPSAGKTSVSNKSVGKTTQKPITYAANYSSPTALTVQSVIAKAEKLDTKTVNTSINTGTDTGPTLGGVPEPTNYKFNLPPHKWSLPLRPVSLDSELVGTNSYDSFHGLRRGRMWFWAGSADIGTFDSSGNATTVGAQVTQPSSTDPTLKKLDNKWAFQFLWNPTSITTSVSRNMDVTPSSADALKVVTGAFPGMESISLNVMLDRVNDFACIKAYQADSSNRVASGANSFTQSSYVKSNYISDPNTINYSDFATYYSGNGYPGESQDISTATKIQKLMAQGTMADLEYLYKAVNGDSVNGGWYNLLGKQTADIGFLLPNLLAVQLGPTLDSMSYVGWITSLSVTHTDFTENMIPVRTQVTINMDCFAGQGLSLS